MKLYRGIVFTRGLQEFIAMLPRNLEMVEVGSATGESAAIFAGSGKVKRITCVDRWRGSKAKMESKFDEVQRRFPNIIAKFKADSVKGAEHFQDYSQDFVYIDADHEYYSARQDIEIWRKKIKPNGYIGGHDYCDKFPGVLRAVHEAFGNEFRIFEDTSWLVQLPEINLSFPVSSSSQPRQIFFRNIRSSETHWRLL